MREQDKYSLWTLCKTLQYRKVFANAVVEETRIPLRFSFGECQKMIFAACTPRLQDLPQADPFGGGCMAALRYI